MVVFRKIQYGDTPFGVNSCGKLPNFGAMAPENQFNFCMNHPVIIFLNQLITILHD